VPERLKPMNLRGSSPVEGYILIVVVDRAEGSGVVATPEAPVTGLVTLGCGRTWSEAKS
jgi:hypothetical protein